MQGSVQEHGAWWPGLLLMLWGTVGMSVVPTCVFMDRPWLPVHLRAFSFTVVTMGGPVLLLRGPQPGTGTLTLAWLPNQGGGHCELLAQVRAETARFCAAQPGSPGLVSALA